MSVSHQFLDVSPDSPEVDPLELGSVVVVVGHGPVHEDEVVPQAPGLAAVAEVVQVDHELEVRVLA